MTLSIELSPELTDRLEQAAKQQGLEPIEYARRLIEIHLPDAKGLALADLMHQWIQEDATEDPEEIARRDAEWEELRANLNANRAAAGERPLFP
jgi:predicted DNA-binding protein